MNEQMLQHLVFVTEAIDDVLPLPGTIEDLTFTTALILAVVAFVREWVVPGARQKRTDSQLEKILESLEKNTDAMEKTLEVNQILLKREQGHN